MERRGRNRNRSVDPVWVIVDIRNSGGVPPRGIPKVPPEVEMSRGTPECEESLIGDI